MGRLPDFIIAGAARSGTTWLCRMLGRHPEIGLAQPIAPEPKFFLVDALFAKGLDHYAARWFDALPQRVLGEKSTNYLDDPVVAERIATALPGVKLIVMLRDPVERTFSNYRWSAKHGHETLDFATAIAREQGGGRPVADGLRYARPFDYLSRSRYAERLAPFYARVPAERILLLRFEDLAADADHLAAATHRFLGVAERPADAEGLGAVNEGDAGTMPDEARRSLAAYFAEPNRALARATGFDVSRWQ